ncbi:MAG: protein-tyrosine phosphatase family protein [Desulfurivibrionaceae bacterium]|jgi:protein-tyrosine phosphatase/Fe-S-cluster containining protein|nr:dual specificity protein phosphatase family protein [Pseudomonadota bacterium]MCG2824702.1 dual specificity protein phosphatase family protein [Desulfobulbaceae bacterium]MDP2003020.1 dual specificity protein phosphatase family protein [Desulfurivibrionaceae bacterium]PKN21802.1 MAG: protein phosphatase [Deltaproteobacteria bacterium HGW-Deltaproteobacteria-3]MBU4228822.1 dual specificity protein phosphatase family protein [Pseudomonadota bacterium]
MTAYEVTWITNQLAVGYAPMSYAELDRIKEMGIDAIVNLCGEFCDLHELEAESGFEVYYLPIPDEGAPDLEAMEQGLAWLDEAIYLGKKILVHCRHGIGRTGTFVSAYLLRRGLGLKVAEKKLRHSRATPANYSQWRLLKKYGKQSGTLSIREPSLESRNVVDLNAFFGEYEALVREVEEKGAGAGHPPDSADECGLNSDGCCRQYFEMTLIEAVFLNNRINRHLTSSQRQEVIARAVEVSRRLRLVAGQVSPGGSEENIERIYAGEGLLCPLSVGKKCLVYEFRPLRCRTWGLAQEGLDASLVAEMLSNLSKNVFFALSGVFPGESELLFPCHDVLSGRFVQVYFYYLSSL